MCHLVKRVTLRQGTTVLHITHNPVEAERLADRRFRIEAGALTESS